MRQPTPVVRTDRRLQFLALGAVGLAVLILAGRAALAGLLLVVPPAMIALKRRDAVTLLTVYIVMLVAIPSRLVVGPLGSVGTPANVIGGICLLWWASSKLAPGLGAASGRQPMRVALALFVSCITISYALAQLHIFDFRQISGSTRAVASMAAVVGVALLAADGISSRARLDTLLRRLTAAAAGMAALGMVQFFTGLNIAGAFSIPGLRVNYEFGAVAQRSIFNRVYATSIHPIEFGVVLALMLPLAVHYALAAPKGRQFGSRLCALLIAFALPMSVSRSAVLALIAGTAMLFAGWSWRQRRLGLVVSFLFLIVVRATVPGLIGTLLSLFTNFSGDPSTKGRTDDYAYVGQFIKQAPFFGRGMFTFLPDQFTTVDNQLLLTIIEMGIVGLLSFLLLFFVGMSCARGARRRNADPSQRELGQALAGSILAAMLTTATFDYLSFPMATGTLFLLLGCAGAMWRLSFTVEPETTALPESVVARLKAATVRLTQVALGRPVTAPRPHPFVTTLREADRAAVGGAPPAIRPGGDRAKPSPAAASRPPSWPAGVSSRRTPHPTVRPPAGRAADQAPPDE